LKDILKYSYIARYTMYENNQRTDKHYQDAGLCPNCKTPTEAFRYMVEAKEILLPDKGNYLRKEWYRDRYRIMDIKTNKVVDNENWEDN
jgi:hypothetical protein